MRKLFLFTFILGFAGVSGLCADKVKSHSVYGECGTRSLESRIYFIDNHVIAVKLVNMVLEKPEQELSVKDISVYSPDDPRYLVGRTPEYFSYWVRPFRYTIRKPLNIKATWIYLFLKTPLLRDKKYEVAIRDDKFIPLDTKTGEPTGVKNSPNMLKAVWRGDFNPSPAIHVNQVGYLPGAPKIAYLSQYSGWKNGRENDSCDVDFSQYKTFSLIDESSGKSIYSGKIEATPVCYAGRRLVRDRLTESRVWQMDFSKFIKSGRYRVQIPGVGVSYPFSIDPKIYNQVFGVLMRGAYHQRCGVALEADFTRHPHPACHLNDAVVPDVSEYHKPKMNFYPQKAGMKLKCAHGHHDAGDFGKYVLNGTLFAYYLLQPYEVFPQRLNFDASPVPQFRDGVPDIIQEAKWELDWISGMQDPEDGGVFILVKPKPTMSYENQVPGTARKPKEGVKEIIKSFLKSNNSGDAPRVVWWKDIHATAAFGAILARAARTPEYVKYNFDAVKNYLSKAEAAWKFCMKHTEPDGSPVPLLGGHHYGKFLGAGDEYCWMAVELWLSTGEEKYHDYFLKHHDPMQGWMWTWWPLKGASGAATRSYVFGKRYGKNPKMLERCRNAVVKAARDAVNWQKEWAYRVSFAKNCYNFKNWGWYFLPDVATYNIVLATTLVSGRERRRFLHAAYFNADQELGNNAENITYLTGIGKCRPVDIVHNSSRFDKIIEPVPGIPLGFHPAGYNRGKSARELMSKYNAGGLPIAYRYVDCWNIAQEFTTPILAAEIMTYAMLANPTLQKAGAPELEVTANGDKSGNISGKAPLKVKFAASAKGLKGKKIRDYYWDLDNEEFSCLKDFEYTFKKPGTYRVCCSVTDDDGWLAYKYITVKAE